MYISQYDLRKLLEDCWEASLRFYDEEQRRLGINVKTPDKNTYIASLLSSIPDELTGVSGMRWMKGTPIKYGKYFIKMNNKNDLPDKITKEVAHFWDGKWQFMDDDWTVVEYLDESARAAFIEIIQGSQPDNREGLINVLRILKKELIGVSFHSNDEMKRCIEDCMILVDVSLEQIENKQAAAEKYDPNFGDEKVCKCGHPYHRHFDWGDNYAVGCKYCMCNCFEELLAGESPIDYNEEAEKTQIASPKQVLEVWAFYYHPRVEQGCLQTISIHRTKDGAIKAMELHKEKKRKERVVDSGEDQEPTLANDHIFPFGRREYWFIDTVNIEQ